MLMADELLMPPRCRHAMLMPPRLCFRCRHADAVYYCYEFRHAAFDAAAALAPYFMPLITLAADIRLASPLLLMPQ